MNADGSGQRVLAQNGLEVGHPTWSRNGKQIAFVGTGLTIYVINLNGSGRRRLTDNTKVEGEDPAWSPVANRIAFTCVTNLLTHHPVSAICTINPDGSALHRLTHEGAEKPASSPDGTKIAFTRHRGRGNAGIYVMNADGAADRRGSPTTQPLIPIHPGNRDRSQGQAAATPSPRRPRPMQRE
jgi:Tol biopolymer transport system component